MMPPPCACTAAPLVSTVAAPLTTVTGAAEAGDAPMLSIVAAMAIVQTQRIAKSHHESDENGPSQPGGDIDHAQPDRGRCQGRGSPGALKHPLPYLFGQLSGVGGGGSVLTR